VVEEVVLKVDLKDLLLQEVLEADTAEELEDVEQQETHLQ
tara:strand:+ start:207 stop:326 length:120 start_codon:yes stop_codon:yes gene_type:complete